VIRRVAPFTVLFIAGIGLMVIGNDSLGKNPVVIEAGLFLVFSSLYVLFSKDGGNSS